jgi:hypothetical protein
MQDKSYAEAVSMCERDLGNLSSFKKWRVPTIEELTTITLFRGGGQGNNIRYGLFPDEELDNKPFWSSTPGSPGAQQVRAMAETRQLDASNFARVRCASWAE